MAASWFMRILMLQCGFADGKPASTTPKPERAVGCLLAGCKSFRNCDVSPTGNRGLCGLNNSVVATLLSPLVPYGPTIGELSRPPGGTNF